RDTRDEEARPGDRLEERRRILAVDRELRVAARHHRDEVLFVVDGREEHVTLTKLLRGDHQAHRRIALLGARRAAAGIDARAPEHEASDAEGLVAGDDEVDLDLSAVDDVSSVDARWAVGW